MKPIFRQLLLSFGASLTFVGFGATWINYRVVRNDLEQQINIRASSITESLKLSSEGLIEINYLPLLDQAVSKYATLPDVKAVAIIDPQGKTLSHSTITYINQPLPKVYPSLVKLTEKAASTGMSQGQRIRLDGQSTFVAILPFNNQLFGATAQRGVAIALLDLEPLERAARRDFLLSSLAISAGIFLILVMLSYLIHKIIISPLSNLNHSVRATQTNGEFKFDAGTLNNEITFLADTFRDVYGQLATYEELEREVQQRKEAELALRESEAKERRKAEALVEAIETLKDTQLQLVQTEKMSSLGQMVAGLAHEINNPVNFIHNNLIYANQYLTDLLELVALYQETFDELPANIEEKCVEMDFEFIQEDASSLFKSLLNGSERICELVISLKNFSRLDQSEQKDVDIHDGIESTLRILRNRLTRSHNRRLGSIEVVREYGDIPLVSCYASQLNQVFMNLLNNAIDALDEVSAGIITITTERLGNGHVRIMVSDNGCGIPEDIRESLFDPFFTTKPVGQGTGLGLSISYKIVVEQHQGKIFCKSTEGNGSSFVLEIPCELKPEPVPLLAV